MQNNGHGRIGAQLEFVLTFLRRHDPDQVRRV
jgi:hypothetical protein